MTAGAIRHGGNESTAGIRNRKIQFLLTIGEGEEKKNQKPQNGADFVTSSGRCLSLFRGNKTFFRTEHGEIKKGSKKNNNETFPVFIPRPRSPPNALPDDISPDNKRKKRE
jgi:hypothetical protein